jgi:hypothetical protein
MTLAGVYGGKKYRYYVAARRRIAAAFWRAYEASLVEWTNEKPVSNLNKPSAHSLNGI